MTKTTTLFGGVGFLGRALVPLLAKQGGIVRLPTRHMDRAMPLKLCGEAGQVVPFICPLQSDAAIAASLQGADSVVNLLGILAQGQGSSFQTIHVEMAARLARIAREEGVKNFVHVSALGADEVSRSHYARSKAAGEKAVQAFFPEAVILRPSVIFGPEDAFLNRLTMLSRLLPVVPLFGGGKNLFQPVFVGDVAAAIIAAIENDEARGRVFELGGPASLSFRDLWEMAAKKAGVQRRFVSLPWPLAEAMAGLMELLPFSPLTRDQIELLKKDNCVATDADGLAALGLVARPL